MPSSETGVLSFGPSGDSPGLRAILVGWYYNFPIVERRIKEIVNFLP